MVRDMDVSMIVPQHGKRFEGPVMVDRFLSWVSDMECGIDLMTQDNYRRPVDYV
jgi:flavorubredoxin